MISILLNGYEFNHDIYELIRVFFPHKDFTVIESIDDYTEGYLIDFSLINIGQILYAITNLYYNQDLISKSKENISQVYINRDMDKSIRIGIKKSLYNALAVVLDNELSWGILTGIRPTKIVHELIRKNTPNNIIFDILTREYKINKEKANLLMSISSAQMKYLYPLDENKYSLYIGIPFCPSRCLYCSFPSLPIGRYSHLIEEYVEKLIYEIDSIKDIMGNKSINTVYIGGGTPTSIPINSLKRIIEAVYKNFGINNIKEFTVEAGRPDTINLDVLKMFRQQQINRISINPQTMNDKTLKLIGRNHTSNDIINAYKMAKDVGIGNINMDLIVGLPGEGVDDIKNTLNILEKLNPQNITVHTLAVKRGSNFKDHIEDFNIQNEKIVEKMLQETREFAEKMKLEPYYLYRQKHIIGNLENIGYAKSGSECIYNISIMEEKETIMGAGVGSTSKIYYPDQNRVNRIFNFKDLKEYLLRTDELIIRKRNLFL